MIEITPQEFKKLTEYMYVNYGINLSRKKNLIEGRLSSILVEKGFTNFTDYLKYIFADKTKTEITILISKLTTNHTFFLREIEHFEFFRNKVLPHLKATVRQKDIRIWSAGCSTGEEPYTMAMIMADYFGSERSAWDTKILATDISVRALAAAEEGVFSAELLNGIPKYWRNMYFRKINEGYYQITKELKQEIIFRIFNLMDDLFPFKRKFHVIFCRNVMIYFDHVTKMRLIQKFYEFTEPGGYLFIGHSESISRHETQYQYIMPAVYRKE
ncbi:MAG: chemotaxis protein CheR [Pelosinus sp.]|nr:chemotaxis protein CheR [Pelosinus sp.]